MSRPEIERSAFGTPSKVQRCFVAAIIIGQCLFVCLLVTLSVRAFIDGSTLSFLQTLKAEHDVAVDLICVGSGPAALLPILALYFCAKTGSSGKRFSLQSIRRTAESEWNNAGRSRPRPAVAEPVPRLSPNMERAQLLGSTLLGCGVVSLIAYPIAFGSGHWLAGLTGGNYETVDWIAVALSGPIMFATFFVVSHLIARVPGQRQLLKDLQTAGRIRSWEDVESSLKAGEGTLILELTNYGPEVGTTWRTWWTPDPLDDHSPTRTSTADCLAEPVDDPFVDWCIDRYLGPKGTGAFLTSIPRRFHRVAGLGQVRRTSMPESLAILTDPFYSQFPRAKIVALPLVIRRPVGRPKSGEKR